MVAAAGLLTGADLGGADEELVAGVDARGATTGGDAETDGVAGTAGLLSSLAVAVFAVAVDVAGGCNCGAGVASVSR